MKKAKGMLAFTFLALLMAIGPAFTGSRKPLEKIYKFEWPASKVGRHYENIRQIRNIIDNSQLPHSDVKQIIQALDQLDNDIALDVQAQDNAEMVAKAKADSLEKAGKGKKEDKKPEKTP